MSRLCSACGTPRVIARDVGDEATDLDEVTVSLPVTALDLLELLWNIAIARNNPSPDPHGEMTQRLVARLETALGLISDVKPPSVEIAESNERAVTAAIDVPVAAFEDEEVTPVNGGVHQSLMNGNACRSLSVSFPT